MAGYASCSEVKAELDRLERSPQTKNSTRPFKGVVMSGTANNGGLKESGFKGAPNSKKGKRR